MINQQYKLVQKIGQGSFGKVYLAHDLYDNEKPVAVKTESTTETFSQLLKEIQTYHLLVGKGFPKLYK